MEDICFYAMKWEVGVHGVLWIGKKEAWEGMPE